MYVPKDSFYHQLYKELGKCQQILQSETHHLWTMDLKDHPMQKNVSQCQFLKADEIPGEVLSWKGFLWEHRFQEITGQLCSRPLLWQSNKLWCCWSESIVIRGATKYAQNERNLVNYSIQHALGEQDCTELTIFSPLS